MFKRIMLTLSFAAAFGAAGLCLTDKTEAQWRRWNQPYTSYYYGTPAYYGYGVPYQPYYGGYYAPRPYYNTYYNTYYSDPGYYYYQPAPRVVVQPGPMWR
jgi:hypothetical protein